MPAAIDTLKLAKRLRQADFTDLPAEALAEAVGEATVEGVATKLDIAELRAELKQDIADLRAELKQDIADLRAELKQDIADLRAELKQDIAGVKQEIEGLRAEMRQESAALRVEMAALESRMLRWMGAGFAATIAVLAAMIQFVHR